MKTKISLLLSIFVILSMVLTACGAPAVTEPAATEPPAEEPAATEPGATEPAATEPGATEPILIRNWLKSISIPANRAGVHATNGLCS